MGLSYFEIVGDGPDEVVHKAELDGAPREIDRLMVRDNELALGSG